MLTYPVYAFRDLYEVCFFRRVLRNSTPRLVRLSVRPAVGCLVPFWTAAAPKGAMTYAFKLTI